MVAGSKDDPSDKNESVLGVQDNCFIRAIQSSMQKNSPKGLIRLRDNHLMLKHQSYRMWRIGIDAADVFVWTMRPDKHHERYSSAQKR